LTRFYQYAIQDRHCYSEHHSGTAVDVGSPDCKPLDAHFDATPTFAWLAEQANRFGFFLKIMRLGIFMSLGIGGIALAAQSKARAGTISERVIVRICRQNPSYAG